MELIYRSTRNANETASQAILKGLANEGGLFVPDSIPALDVSLEDLAKMNYQQVAYEVMKLMFTDFTEAELKHCIDSAYDSKFDTPVIAPLVNKAGAYYLELFHGSTIAFKDMALSILPYLLTTSAKKNGVKRSSSSQQHQVIQVRLPLQDLQMFLEQRSSCSIQSTV